MCILRSWRDAATTPIRSGHPLGSDGDTLGQHTDFDVRGFGRRLPQTDAPEGWVKKVERDAREKSGSASFIFGPQTLRPARPHKKRKDARAGFHAKARGAAEAGRLHQRIHRQAHKQGDSISTFTELWKAFCAVKSGQWSKKTRENLQCLFGKHVVPIIGQQAPREVTLTSLQLLLNKMAEDGYGKSAVGQVRTYIKSCFEYATDEDLIRKSPARKLAMPKIQKKSCERFLSSD